MCCIQPALFCASKRTWFSSIFGKRSPHMLEYLSSFFQSFTAGDLSSSGERYVCSYPINNFANTVKYDYERGHFVDTLSEFCTSCSFSLISSVLSWLLLFTEEGERNPGKHKTVPPTLKLQGLGRLQIDFSKRPFYKRRNESAQVWFEPGGSPDHTEVPAYESDAFHSLPYRNGARGICVRCAREQVME